MRCRDVARVLPFDVILKCLLCRWCAQGDVKYELYLGEDPESTTSKFAQIRSSL